MLDAYIKLSSPLTIQYINELKENELKAKYSKATRRKFVESLIKGKISGKIKFKLRFIKKKFYFIG